MRVIRIGLPDDFGVSRDGNACRQKEGIGLCTKPPVTVSKADKVALGNPLAGFGGMAAASPLPEGVEDGAIHPFKDHFADDVLMVVSPPANHRIENSNQPFRFEVEMGLNGVADVGEEVFDILTGRNDQQLAVVFPNVLSEKIKTVLNRGDFGFLWRQFQTTLVQEGFHDRFDLCFQQFTGSAGHHEIIGVDDDVDFGAFTLGAALGIDFPQFLLQTVERQSGQDGGTDPALRSSLQGLMENGLINIAGLEPFSQNGFVHWDLRFQPLVRDFIKARTDVAL